MKAPLKQHFRSPVLWPLLGLLLLVVLNLILGGPNFLRITLQDGHLFGMPIDILNRGSTGMLLALGMTLVIATGGIDLSVGSIMAVSGAVAATLLSRHGATVPAALAAALLVSLAAGLLSGTLVARLGIQPIVATLILMVGGRGIAQQITNGNVIIIDNPAFSYLGNGYLLALPFAALLALALYLATHLLLRRTAAGLFIEAVGDNETASRFAGLAAARAKILVYAFSALCAGLAGILAASNIRAADPYRAGEMMELDAIFAVVVGGTALTGGRFLLAGALLGALLLQTLTITMYNIGVPPAIAPVPKALIILAVCLAQSDTTRRWLRGLFQFKKGAAA